MFDDDFAFAGVLAIDFGLFMSIYIETKHKYISPQVFYVNERVFLKYLENKIVY